MFIDIAVAGIITALVSTYTYQVGKHGTKYVWKAMFKDDAPKHESYQPKHSRTFYDWNKDEGFKKTNGRKSA